MTQDNTTDNIDQENLDQDTTDQYQAQDITLPDVQPSSAKTPAALASAPVQLNLLDILELAKFISELDELKRITTAERNYITPFFTRVDAFLAQAQKQQADYQAQQAAAAQVAAGLVETSSQALNLEV